MRSNDPTFEVSPTPQVQDTSNDPPEQNMRSTDPIVHVVQPVAVRMPTPVHIEPIVIVSNEPEISNAVTPESKKEFEIEGDSKKEFEKPAETKKNFEPQDEIEFDMDADVGRWRIDEQVRELVIYRWEFKKWPKDVEDKINHPTGLESYYELRYFKDGTNRKGERYADLYKKHRAKRDLWVDEYSAEQAIGNAQVDDPAIKSNVVPLRRTGTSN